MQRKSIRLEKHIYPTHYELTLFPDLLSSTFSGKEIIKIKIDKEVNQITLHSKDIDIETVKYTSGKEEQFAIKIKYDTKKETATFYFKNKIKKGKGEISIVFSGIINENLRGFYKSKYILNGKEKHIATTQFEATDARRAFPCFDEPAHKAIFIVSLIIPENHTAISNTLPINIQEHNTGYKIISFEPTPRMSTYLLAFIIGEFEYVEGVIKRAKSAGKFSRSGSSSSLIRGPENLPADEEDVQVRVFTTPGKKHQAKFALEVAIKSIQFFNKYFDIPYPLPTLDLIAIPDFESSAMENWGAITFRETAILVDEKHTSVSNKQWIAIVIAHEIAHQWFGNLVTMKWWTDLWLNEGFASYMENLCVDKMFPEWHVWDLYISDRYAVAMRLDALSNSHPIEITVNHPSEINEIFDMVSYAKGSAMIRQLAEYIGHDKFQDGLRYYLKKHSYKNTDTKDLWDAFEKMSKKPVNKLMSAWTKETGYPLITLHSPKQGLGLSIEQERFFSSRISAKKYKEKKGKKNIWPIPLKYESGDEILKILMTKKSVPLIGASIGKINKEEETFARVRYNNETLLKLKNEIENGTLSTKDRLGIIRDLFALAEGGYITTDIALEFALNYKNEKEYIVWTKIAGGIARVYNIMGKEDFADKYKNYALSLFSPLIKRIGFDKRENEEYSDTFLRNLAISQSAFYGDEITIKKAQKLFVDCNKNKVPADIRGVVYNIVARNGNEKTWKVFKELYKRENLHEEKDRYGSALTAFTDKELLKKTLDFILTDDVKSQDAPHLLAMVWQNKEGRDMTWKFIKSNWKIILKKYGEGGHFLSRLLSPLGTHTNIKDLKDAKKFFAKHLAPGAERTLEQSYEKIESNVAWLKDDKKEIKNWLNKLHTG